MTLSAAFLAAWKSLRPWREDPRLARAHHADMFARGEREKLLLWREGWHCPTAGMLNRGAGGVSHWADANPNTSRRVAKRASTLLTSVVTASRKVAWLGGGFPPLIVASDWMEASAPPPSSDVSRPFALGLLWWRPPALHSRVCPWLINPPHAHVHTHNEITPGSPTTSCLLVSDKHTHFSTATSFPLKGWNCF